MAKQPTKSLGYDEVLTAARRLAPDEQERLVEELGEYVRKRDRYVGKHSILELRGLGKEIWRDPETGELIDAQEYVNRERGSW